MVRILIRKLHFMLISLLQRSMLVAVAASLVSAGHPQQSIPCLTSSAIHPISTFASHQLSATNSYNINSFRVKATAETISTPKMEQKPSHSGKRQALISLSDKNDLALLGVGLQELGFTIVSTGGAASALEGSGVVVTKALLLDGRVKTLHPNVHGGILARRDQEHHMEALNHHGIDKFPPSHTVPLSLKSLLRYGENPHQKAAFYVDKSLAEVNAGGIATAVQHHGKMQMQHGIVSEFSKPTCVVVKHTNPCGVASRDDIIEAHTGTEGVAFYNLAPP